MVCSKLERLRVNGAVEGLTEMIFDLLDDKDPELVSIVLKSFFEANPGLQVIKTIKDVAFDCGSNLAVLCFLDGIGAIANGGSIKESYANEKESADGRVINDLLNLCGSGRFEELLRILSTESPS